jgi:tetraacyldisaccharide 4'-kinase
VRHALQQAWLARGPLAIVLLPLMWCYRVGWTLRRALYRLGVLHAHQIGAPVVVVGNLVAGGAGKTPTVLALIPLLQRQGWHPGIVSRGYGRRNDVLLDVQPDTPARDCGDEPLLLRLRTEVPVLVGRDRVAAAMELRVRHPDVDLVVCDDGLQHWRLARTAQVIVFDERGAGNGWLLPAGPLREPLPEALPPRSVVLYNASGPTTPLPGHLGQRRLTGAVSIADWWRGMPARIEILHALRGRRMLAAAGIARPHRFFEMLRAHGLTIDEYPLPDHHDFARLDWPAGTHEVIVTEKDAVKLDPSRVRSMTVWVAALDFGVDADFESALLALLPRRSTLH